MEGLLDPWEDPEVRRQAAAVTGTFDPNAGLPAQPPPDNGMTFGLDEELITDEADPVAALAKAIEGEVKASVAPVMAQGTQSMLDAGNPTAIPPGLNAPPIPPPPGAAPPMPWDSEFPDPGSKPPPADLESLAGALSRPTPPLTSETGFEGPQRGLEQAATVAQPHPMASTAQAPTPEAGDQSVERMDKAGRIIQGILSVLGAGLGIAGAATGKPGIIGAGLGVGNIGRSIGGSLQLPRARQYAEGQDALKAAQRDRQLRTGERGLDIQQQVADQTRENQEANRTFQAQEAERDQSNTELERERQLAKDQWERDKFAAENAEAPEERRQAVARMATMLSRGRVDGEDALASLEGMTSKELTGLQRTILGSLRPGGGGLGGGPAPSPSAGLVIKDGQVSTLDGIDTLIEDPTQALAVKNAIQSMRLTHHGTMETARSNPDPSVWINEALDSIRRNPRLVDQYAGARTSDTAAGAGSRDTASQQEGWRKFTAQAVPILKSTNNSIRHWNKLSARSKANVLRALAAGAKAGGGDSLLKNVFNLGEGARASLTNEEQIAADALQGVANREIHEYSGAATSAQEIQRMINAFGAAIVSSNITSANNKLRELLDTIRGSIEETSKGYPVVARRNVRFSDGTKVNMNNILAEPYIRGYLRRHPGVELLP